MRVSVARGIMTLAVCCLCQSRRAWSAAMRAEFEVAVEDGHALSFALGCFATACRELVTREEGCFTLTTYTLVLGVMLPMAALQTGCALFGLPYLYPGRTGLSGAVLDGRVQEGFLRGVYQSAVPSLTLIVLLLGIGHLCVAWAMLEGNWGRVRRLALLGLATMVTLIGLIGVLFLDGSRAVLQALVLTIEFATIMTVARWHARLFHDAGQAEHPG